MAASMTGRTPVTRDIGTATGRSSMSLAVAKSGRLVEELALAARPCAWRLEAEKLPVAMLQTEEPVLAPRGPARLAALLL